MGHKFCLARNVRARYTAVCASCCHLSPRGRVELSRRRRDPHTLRTHVRRVEREVLKTSPPPISAPRPHRRSTKKHPCGAAQRSLYEAQHAKPPAGVTGDSWLYKLWCIRARETCISLQQRGGESSAFCSNARFLGQNLFPLDNFTIFAYVVSVMPTIVG